MTDTLHLAESFFTREAHDALAYAQVLQDIATRAEIAMTGAGINPQDQALTDIYAWAMDALENIKEETTP